jgi:hypothetical protein
MLSACGDANGPKADNLAGTWLYSTSLSYAPFVCSVSNAELTITQHGDTLAGTYAHGALICGTQVDPESTGTIRGSVSGSTVNFFLSGIAFNTGSWSKNSMSGDATLPEDNGGQNISLTGAWSATRTGQ